LAMTRIALNGGLDQMVAARFARPVVSRLSGQVEHEARILAPAGKAWLTYEDERVRPAHVVADGQMIPGNLRYKLRKQVYVRGGGRGRRPSIPGHTVLTSGFVLGRVPRDESLPIDQTAECRCESVDLPGVVARTIHARSVVQAGTRVSAEISCGFNRAAESEFGTSGDIPARFMSGALRVVAIRFQSSRG
jgi:hypothetical protein